MAKAECEALGLGHTRLKMMRFLVLAETLDEDSFSGQVIFNVNNQHKNVTGQVVPAAKQIRLGETDGV